MKNILSFLIVFSIFLLIASFKSLQQNSGLPKEVEKAFEKALDFAKQKKDKPHFTYYFEDDLEKGNYNSIKVNIDYGAFFNKNDKFLILTCEYHKLSDDKYYRVYLKESDSFKLLVEEYTNHGEQPIFMEINGDENIDFVIPYSPSSGCCPRQSKIVFLYKDKNFVKYNFINPTFSPKEKIVRGLGYGYFPEVGLYKYKWSGTKLDTVEYIYRTKESDFKKFIRTKKEIHLPKHSQGEILDFLPKEYQNINEIDWFLKEYN
ncbi:hypothetical protein V9L05_19505 [Bernardetia sp. Wsw4-3y2]|uniref:hypothetical protein n=1 Tax=Bernardetia sp. Wsw4-3y2 TaxID=3127471 RepID=UPI0030CE43B1